MNSGRSQNIQFVLNRWWVVTNYRTHPVWIKPMVMVILKYICLNLHHLPVFFLLLDKYNYVAWLKSHQISSHGNWKCMMKLLYYSVISPKWPYKMGRHVHPPVHPSVHPSVNIFCFFYLLHYYSAVYFEFSTCWYYGPHNRSGPDFAISGGYPKKLISYAVEALSLAHSLVLSLQIIFK